MFFRPKKIPQLSRDLDPDEIFLDAHNLPAFNRQQFEGHIEKPISKTVIRVLTLTFSFILVLYLGRVAYLQLERGEAYALRSEHNSLRLIPLYADRGIIYDRNNVQLAWNLATGERQYKEQDGLAHVIGYLGYPSEKELDAGLYDDPKALVGKAGIESTFNTVLAGDRGVLIEEVNALGEAESSHTQKRPANGEALVLSIDSRVQEKLFGLIKKLSHDAGYTAGSGVLMNVETGEVLALTSYPEYNANLMTSTSTARIIFQDYLNDKRQPFLDRAVSGLYTPGSVFKPIMAIGALEEGVISPFKQILSTGSISIPNPYNPKEKTVFKDWKAHGLVDIRRALAVSSDVYFYEVGGGYPGQQGIGIANINKYARMFGLATTTGIELKGEAKGLIPTPEWKALNFPNDPMWRIGNTYHTSIGQYGVQVTPIQMARVTAALANNGRLIKPTLIAGGEVQTGEVLPLKPANLQIVREGMRMAAVDGTAKGLNISGLQVAAKTGTAELGITKVTVNSWVVGFFPYEHPQYAFTVVMEKGNVHNQIGGVFIMRQLLDWMLLNTPEYFK